MRKFHFLIALLLLCFSGCQQDVDQLVARHIEAMGGLQKQRAIQTLRIIQRIETDNPADNFAFVIMRKRGNKVRMEEPVLLPAQEEKAKGVETAPIPASVQPTISGCDGQTSWHKFGNAPARTDIGGLCDGPADIDSLLLNYKEKGLSVELAGREKIEGSKLYHLKVTSSKNGRLLHFYLDARTLLVARIVSEENGMHQEDIYSDYRRVDGIMVPFCDEMRWWPLKNAATQEATAGSLKVNKAPAHQRQIVEKIEFNVPLEDSLFAMPSANGTKNP